MSDSDIKRPNTFWEFCVKKIFLVSFLSLIVSISPVFAQRKKPVVVKKPVTANNQPVKTSPQTAEVPFVNKTLANGLEVIVLPDATIPIVTVEMAVRNGSFTEPPELNGLSHLYEHMFFKSNGAIERREPYLRDIGQLGITYNGETKEEVVNYYFTTTSPYISTAMRFVKDSVRYPTFDEEEFAREKEVVIGEIDRNESNPFSYLNKTLMEKLFFKYPTRKNALGTRETVATATTAKMRLIQGRYYVPNNSALVVTGNVNPEEVFKYAEQYFGDWQRRPVEPFKEFPLVEHPPLPKSDGYIVEQPVQNVLINIGWHGPSIGKDNASTYAADVFSYIITQPDSKFQRDLVDTGLVAGVSFNYYTQRNVGPIQIILLTTPDKAKAALNAVYAEIAQFDKPDYFSDTELQNSITILESQDLFSREKLSDYTHTLSFWWSSTGIDYFRGYQKNLRAITRADINHYIKTYVQGKPHIGVALLSPESQSQARLTPADLIGK
jgi:zinc protease